MKGAAGDEPDGEPWFAAGKNLETNELIVVRGHDHPRLLSTTVRAEDLSWIGPPPRVGGRYGAKTRYRQDDAACVVEAITPDTLVLQFLQPQWAVTPGQSVVLYEADVCLGGGLIQA